MKKYVPPEIEFDEEVTLETIPDKDWEKEINALNEKVEKASKSARVINDKEVLKKLFNI